MRSVTLRHLPIYQLALSPGWLDSAASNLLFYYGSHHNLLRSYHRSHTLSKDRGRKIPNSSYGTFTICSSPTNTRHLFFSFRRFDRNARKLGTGVNPGNCRPTKRADERTRPSRMGPAPSTPDRRGRKRN